VDEGHVETFQELIETTEWENYGRASGNSKCQNCMVHSGYEPSAVNDTFGSLRGFLKTAQLTMFGSKTMPGDETAPLAPRSRTSPAESELVSLETNFSQPEESPTESNVAS
jgi:hypothetical protein